MFITVDNCANSMKNFAKKIKNVKTKTDICWSRESHSKEQKAIYDLISKICFLIDTGLEISLIHPSSGHSMTTNKNTELFAANNTRVFTYGTISHLLLGLQHNFEWNFIVANVAFPILGADFLQHFGILPDLHHRQLIDTHTRLLQYGFDCHIIFLVLALSHFSQSSLNLDPKSCILWKINLSKCWWMVTLGQVNLLRLLQLPFALWKDLKSGGYVATIEL